MPGLFESIAERIPGTASYLDADIARRRQKQITDLQEWKQENKALIEKEQTAVKAIARMAGALLVEAPEGYEIHEDYSETQSKVLWRPGRGALVLRITQHKYPGTYTSFQLNQGDQYGINPHNHLQPLQASISADCQMTEGDWTRGGMLVTVMPSEMAQVLAESFDFDQAG